MISRRIYARDRVGRLLGEKVFWIRIVQEYTVGPANFRALCTRKLGAILETVNACLSKLVMCSDLSSLLKISYEMNKGGNIPTLAHFVIAMFSFDRYNIYYYYFYRVPYNNAKEEQG